MTDLGTRLPRVTLLLAPGTDQTWLVHLAAEGAVRLLFDDPVSAVVTSELVDGTATLTLAAVQNLRELVGRPAEFQHVDAAGRVTALARGTTERA